jgi:ATP-dependent DNA ligase
MYSRKLKDIPGVRHVYDALKTLFIKINTTYPGVYLDGELYKNGHSLQEISGYLRRDADSKTTKRQSSNGEKQLKLEFHIFDVFFPVTTTKMAQLDFSDRELIRMDIMSKTRSKYLVSVETFIADTQADDEKLYRQFLSENYEGSIVKNVGGVYEFSATRERRTYNSRKRKPRHSAEYKVVGYEQGKKGKDKGAIIWRLITKGSKNNPPVEFTSAPVGMNYEQRYAMFKLFEGNNSEFTDNWEGKMMTVEYDDISDDGVPLRAKAKCLRVFA